MQNQQDDDYIILWQPVLGPRQAVKSLSFMPTPLPPQPIPIQQTQQEDTPALLPLSSGRPQTEERPRKGQASPKQKEFIINLANRLNMTESEVCQAIGAKSIEQMSNAQANEFISKYKDAKPLLF